MRPARGLLRHKALRLLPFTLAMSKDEQAMDRVATAAVAGALPCLYHHEMREAHISPVTDN